MPKYSSKRVILLVKVLIVFTSFGFIACKLLNQEQFSQLFNIVKQFNLSKFLVLLLVVVLMIFNWSVEAFKWKELIHNLQKISFLNSFKAIFSGITISIFTPNRTGEFAGRIIKLDNENRIQAIFATFIGNIAQLIVTLTLGLISISLLPFKFKGVFIDNSLTPSWISFICITLSILIIYIFFNINYFEGPFNKIRFLNKYKNYFASFFSFNKNELLYFLFLSFARYLTFIIQFTILLRIFNVEISTTDAMITLSLIYFTMTIIPTIALGEIGIRGSVAIFFLSKFSENLTGIFLSSTTLWLINLAIPALIGSIIIYKSKI